MGNIRIIDGHEFKEISDGLYKTDVPYEISEDWCWDELHFDMEVVGPYIAGIMYAEYISVNNAGSHELVKILNKDRDNQCCMQGMPSKNSLGY